MVKRQNERLYESSRERQANRSNVTAAHVSTAVRPLPFSHCALQLTPYEHPVCTKSSSVIFESAALLSYVLEHKKDPVTGDVLQTRDLITLAMSQDEEGRWCCPVLTKPLSEHTKFVAIVQPDQTSASVYSYEAYQNFNVKIKSYEDLVTGEPFDPKADVLILYDPDNDTQRRDINTFYHIRNARHLEKGANNPNVRHSLTASRILEKIDHQRPVLAAQLFQKTPELLHESAQYLDDAGSPIRVLAKDVTGIAYTNAATTTSLTSTAVPRHNSNQERDAILDEILQAQFRLARKLKKKGYVRLFLNCLNEPLVLELHCDMVPRTCANFLGLCWNGAYDGVGFHRLIPSFMIQGGKPLTDDIQEESYWGGSFRDEFDDRLKHTGPGILSMANAGEHTNKRQFFITFKSCPHLDRKHTIFGSVVNESKAKLLAQLKMIPTKTNDVPRQDVTIVRTEIVVDPMAEAKEMERQRLLTLLRQRSHRTSTNSHAATNTRTKASAIEPTGGVGKYLKLPAIAADVKKRPPVVLDDKSPPAAQRKVESSATTTQAKKAKFGDFSGW
jgi:peptidyl-prolyl cis-trans isomerase-like 2